MLHYLSPLASADLSPVAFSGFFLNSFSEGGRGIVLFLNPDRYVYQFIPHSFSEFNLRSFSVGVGDFFFSIQTDTFTNAINAGTSTKGPIYPPKLQRRRVTPANACSLLMPKTPITTAIVNSKLFPAALNAIEVLVEYSAPIFLPRIKLIKNIMIK